MAATSSAPVLVYADGSCEGNPGPGGWGVVIVTPEGTHRLSGGDSQTTNNRMEIMGAIEALRALDPGLPVILRSDSQYLVKTMNDGWRRTKNVDLWRQLDHEVARHEVRFEWVRGHAGDARNEEADELAREAARCAATTASAGRGAQAAADSVAPGSVAPGSATKRKAGLGQPSRPARGGAGAATSTSASPRGPLDDDGLVLDKLVGLLEPDERIANCAICKQAFVAHGDEGYCSLIGCQMIKRC